MDKITETLVVTGSGNNVHVAPFGVRFPDEKTALIAPFKPSRSLDNFLACDYASINDSDDPLMFAACLTRRRLPSVVAGRSPKVMIVDQACRVTEVRVKKIEDDPQRVRVLCQVVERYQRRDWQGFNRSRAAIIEACVLLSRLHILPADDVDAQMQRLGVIVDKTAGEREYTAWQWLSQYRRDWRAKKTPPARAKPGGG